MGIKDESHKPTVFEKKADKEALDKLTESPKVKKERTIDKKPNVSDRIARGSQDRLN
jgi:hypothetical protein